MATRVQVPSVPGLGAELAEDGLPRARLLPLPRLAPKPFSRPSWPGLGPPRTPDGQTSSPPPLPAGEGLRRTLSLLGPPGSPEASPVPLPPASPPGDSGSCLRPKRRPASALLSEPPRLGLPGKMPPAPPEKTWVRRPRPLSVDLTARFEGREPLAGTGPSPDVAPKPRERTASGHGQTDGTRPAPLTPPGEDGGPQKAPQSPPPRPGPMETPAGEAEQTARGGGQSWPPEAATPPTATPEPSPQKASISVQDRIKGWAADGGDPRPAPLRRRTLSARPLSADLTRLFSSPGSSREVRYETCPESGGGETPKDVKGKLRDSHGLDRPPPRSSWRLGTLREKPLRPAEQRDDPASAVDKGRGDACEASRTLPALATAAAEEDDGGFQTVRATLFEHHVERHRVAVSPDPSAEEPRARSGSEQGSWRGLDPLQKPDPKTESTGRQEKPRVEKLEHPAVLNGLPRQRPEALQDKGPWGGGRSPPPACCKVKARFELVQTPGERVHSEGVPVAQQGKAGALRGGHSRLSLSGGLCSQEEPPGVPSGSPGGHTGAVHRVSSVWEARGILDPLEDTSGGRWPSPKWTGGTSRGLQKDPPALSPEQAREPSPGMAFQPAFRALDGRQSPGSQPGGTTPSAGGASPTACLPDPPSRLQDLTPASRARLPQETPEQKPVLGSGDPEGQLDPTPRPKPEVRMRKANPSDPRPERWRRRTLPHDVKFEEFGFLAPEHSGKMEQRRAGGWSPPASSGGQDQPPGALSVAKQGPSTEPRATFFAVTYQISEAPRAKSLLKLENPVEPSRNTSQPQSPLPLASPCVPPDHEEAREPAGRGDRTRGRERASISRTWKPADLDLARPPGDRLPEPSVAKPEASAPRWEPEDGPARQRDLKAGGDRASPGSAPQDTPTLRSRPRANKEGRLEPVAEAAPRGDGAPYRTSVLDLDALMREYHRQPPGSTPEASAPESPGQHGGLERGRRSRWRPDSEGSPDRATSTRASGNRSSAPLWALPTPPPQQPLDPEQPRKRLSSTKEEAEKEGRKAGEHRGPKCLDHLESRPAGQQGPGYTAPVFPREPSSDQPKGTQRHAEQQGPGCTSPVSPRESPSDQPKGAPRRWAPLDRTRAPADMKRTCSEKGAPAKLREGLAVLQEARERRREHSRGRAMTSAGVLEPSWPEPGPQGPQVSPLGPGTERPQDSEPRYRTPTASGPQRSHSFCRDRRNSPLVDQLRQCFSRRPPEAKDTDTLVREPDGRYGTCPEQRQPGDSPAPESPSPESSGQKPRSHRPPSLSSPTEPASRGVSVDTAATSQEPPVSPEAPSPQDSGPVHKVEDFSFIHQTSVLDSSALKTRVQLSKRSGRRLPSALRHSRTLEDSLEEEAPSAWMFRDSTEEKSPRREEEEEEEEEESPRPERTPAAQPQRLPALPGLDPALLKAQLPKRPQTDGETPSRAPPPKAQRAPFPPGTPGSRVLPPSLERSGRSEEPPPQWLQELKSRKRQSLHENQA